MSDLPASTQPPAALRIALVGGIRRRRSRIRIRASAALATSVAVVAALFGGGVFTGGPEPVLAIDDNGGEWVTVRILDGEAGAAQMTQELHDAGIDGRVQRVPSVPKFVGNWMGIAQAPRCGLGCVGLAGTDARFKGDAFRIKRDVIHKLAETHAILYVGRRPEAGETPRAFPPRRYDLRVAPLGNPSRSGSWAQAVNPIRVRRPGSR